MYQVNLNYAHAHTVYTRLPRKERTVLRKMASLVRSRDKRMNKGKNRYGQKVSAWIS